MLCLLLLLTLSFSIGTLVILADCSLVCGIEYKWEWFITVTGVTFITVTGGHYILKADDR